MTRTRGTLYCRRRKEGRKEKTPFTGQWGIKTGRKQGWKDGMKEGRKEGWYLSSTRLVPLKNEGRKKG